MKIFTYTEIKNNLAKFLDMAKNGEEIIINTGGKKKVAIVPYKESKRKNKRVLGGLKGKASFEIKDDFKMSDEEFLAS